MALVVGAGNFLTGTGTGDLAAQSAGADIQAILCAMTRATLLDSAKGGASLGFGAATGTSARAAAGYGDDDGASPASNSNRYGTASALCVAGTGSNLPDGLVDVAAIGATDWTPTIDNAFGESTHAIWLTLGGMTAAKVGTFVASTSVGNQDITGLGFNNPDVVILWTSGVTTLDSVTGNGALAIGVGVSATNRGHVGVYLDDNETTTASDAMIANDLVLGVMASGVPTPPNRWDYVGGITGGFRINRIAGSAAIQIHYLALKGVSAKVLFPATGTNTNAAVVTGATFRPKAVLVLGTGNATAAQSAGTAEGRLSIGWATAAGGRAVYGHSQDNVNTTQTFCYTSATKLGIRATNTEALQGDFDLDSLDIDGFTRDMLTADAQQNVYLALCLGVAPTALAMATEPSSTATSAVAFATQPVVKLVDDAVADVDRSGITVTAAIASGSGTLGGTTTADTDENGEATFTDLAITGSGAHTIEFTATGLTAVTSATITVSAAGAAIGGLVSALSVGALQVTS